MQDPPNLLMKGVAEDSALHVCKVQPLWVHHGSSHIHQHTAPQQEITGYLGSAAHPDMADSLLTNCQQHLGGDLHRYSCTAAVLELGQL